MTSYRQHYSTKHQENPDLVDTQPYVHKNQPSRRELAATLGSVYNIPNGTLSEAPIVEPEPPYPDSNWPQSPSHLDTNIPAPPTDLPTGTSNVSPQRPPLELRFPWFDRSRYNKIVDADGVTRYVHRTAGRVLRKVKTCWEQLLEDRKKTHPKAPWHPFASEAEWKLAYWLATCKSSQSKIDEFLGMDGILAETPTFSSAYNLFHKLENDLAGFSGPPWHCQQILLEHFPNGKHEDLVLYLRDLEECLDCLVGRPDLDGEIWFPPEVLHEAGQHPDAALGGVIFGSDKTHLTHYSGDVKVHALYVSLGNIVKDTRAQTSKRAWMLLAYIPICKWENTIKKVNPKSKAHKSALPGILSRRLFHFCMEIICQPLRELTVHEIVNPQGNVRLIFYVLLAYLADLKEQYMIAALDKSNCVHCTATTNDFGSPEPHPTHTSQSILEAIARVQEQRHPNADPYHFSLGANKERLGDVEYPFWVELPFVDICQSLSVDLLHSYYKYFFDHPFRWNTNSIGEDELDARMKAQVPYSGGWVFSKGVTHISQMSGKEHRALLKVHLSIIANSSAKYSRKLTEATQALVDYIYYAQLPSHTELTLQAYKAVYEEFHRFKDVWIKNGSRRGEKTVIDHFNIPKLHAGHHMTDQIRAKGTADNFSMETIEHLHMDTIKEAYPATNKKDWEKQTIRWLIRREKITKLRLFHTWRKTVGPGADPAVTPVNSDNPEAGATDIRGSDGTEGQPVIAPENTEAMMRQFKRGGFAAEVTSKAEVESVPEPSANAIKKRKRQIDNPDDKDNRAMKRVERA
ncbi:hypothetical protein FRC08_001783 [Ceratobasidium sp. 394]|nr:hypothetical protein FRC08_001783 [Ceratobasidium sp. 394]